MPANYSELKKFQKHNLKIICDSTQSPGALAYVHSATMAILVVIA